tara:strand:- start:331 stop:471 length:141 start_codon:yes stop_codon:yes gene_type:complete
MTVAAAKLRVRPRKSETAAKGGGRRAPHAPPAANGNAGGAPSNVWR